MTRKDYVAIAAALRHSRIEGHGPKQPQQSMDLAQFDAPRDDVLFPRRIERERDALLAECKRLTTLCAYQETTAARIAADLTAEIATTKRQREQIQALREALEAAAGALDAGLNSGDAVSAADDMDGALLQARAALAKVSE